MVLAGSESISFHLRHLLQRECHHLPRRGAACSLLPPKRKQTSDRLSYHPDTHTDRQRRLLDCACKSARQHDAARHDQQHSQQSVRSLHPRRTDRHYADYLGHIPQTPLLPTPAHPRLLPTPNRYHRFQQPASLADFSGMHRACGIRHLETEEEDRARLRHPVLYHHLLYHLQPAL